MLLNTEAFSRPFAPLTQATEPTKANKSGFLGAFVFERPKGEGAKIRS